MATTFEALNEQDQQIDSAAIRGFAKQFLDRDRTADDLAIVKEKDWNPNEVDAEISLARERARLRAQVAGQSDLTQRQNEIRGKLQEANRIFELARAEHEKTINPLIGDLEDVKAKLLEAEGAKRALISTACYPDDRLAMEIATRALSLANNQLAAKRQDLALAERRVAAIRQNIVDERALLRPESTPRAPWFAQAGKQLSGAKYRVEQLQKDVADAEKAVTVAEQRTEDAQKAAFEA